MNVHLSPQLEKFVQDKVKAGRHNSASEVLAEALQLLEERDHVLERRREGIRKKIDEGWESLERGEGLDGEAVFAELETELADLEKTRKAG